MQFKIKLLSDIPTLLLVLCCVSQNLQAQTATGTLRAEVVDPSAAVVPGASIRITGNGLSRSGKTDGQGRFTVTVPAGVYSVLVTSRGFLPFTSADVNVRKGQVSPLSVSLQLASEQQQIQVSESTAGQVSVDPAQNAGAIVLKNEDLDQLPDDPDDLQADLTALAGPAAGPNGAQFFVDGFSGGQLPPKSSIREIRINSNPFAAEFDSPGFGRIEIFTKPGTDKYHGQTLFDIGDSILDTRNPLLISAQPAYTSKLYMGNLGGPLGKKASFFLDFNRREIDDGTLILARYLNSSLQQTPYNGVFATPQRYWTLSPRIDYQIDANNTLVMRYSHTQNSGVGGVGQFNLPTQETLQNQKNNLVQVTETAVVGADLVVETHFQFFESRIVQNGTGDFTVPGIDVNSAFNSGGAPFSVNLTDTKSYELQSTATLTRGKHLIKAGGRLRIADLESETTANFNGTYTFATPVAPSSGPYCLSGISNPTSLDLYQQTALLLSKGLSMKRVLALGCGPSQFTLRSGNPLQTVSQPDLGLFVQDDWRLRPNLTISSGLRYETQGLIHDHLDLAPRFAVAWAPGRSDAQGGASKTVIRAGWGVFFSRFPETDVLNALRFNGIIQTNYLVNNSPAGLGALAYYPNIPPVALLSARSQAVYQIDGRLRAPYIMQSAVGVERALPGRTTMTVNFIDTRGVHALRQRDINAYLPGTYTGPGTGVRPYPTVNDIYLYETSGIFKQAQLIANVGSRVNKHISLQGYYVYGQAHTNANGFPMDQYDANADYGRASNDARSRAYVGGNVGLPFGLTVAPFLTLSSGLPFNITTGSDFNGDGIFNQRPSFATGPCGTSTPNLRCTAFGTFNITPTPGQAVIPYNYGHGPAQVSANFRLSRTWGWGETESTAASGGSGRNGAGGRGGGLAGLTRGINMGSFGGTGRKYNLTLSLAARNAINHVNYGAPNGVLTSPFFGQSTSLAGQGGGAFGGAGSAAGNRRFNLQLRLSF